MKSYDEGCERRARRGQGGGGTEGAWGGKVHARAAQRERQGTATCTAARVGARQPSNSITTPPYASILSISKCTESQRTVAMPPPAGCRVRPRSWAQHTSCRAALTSRFPPDRACMAILSRASADMRTLRRSSAGERMCVIRRALPACWPKCGARLHNSDTRLAACWASTCFAAARQEPAPGCCWARHPGCVQGGGAPRPHEPPRPSEMGAAGSCDMPPTVCNDAGPCSRAFGSE